MNKEKLAKKFLNPFLSGIIKTALAYPRFLKQLNVCKQGFKDFGTQYNQKVLFVAGLPKSGTTWLEKMLFSLPGFHEIMIPEAVYYEQRNIGSHDFDFPSNTISRLKGSLAVLKLHVHGSLNNAEILKTAGLNYVVLFRDLRDVAVSYYFYVKNTPWHPEYKTYNHFNSPSEGLHQFAKTLLPEYKEWVYSWRNVADANCLIIKYEDLKSDTLGHLRNITKHYKLIITDEELNRIVDKNSFKTLSTGRKEGESNNESFFRKGISGDWKNHFDDELKEIYKKEIGDFLIAEGYEKNDNW
ncbi:MAG: sulfotransferase domain-containing protein [Cyclobacteriaceae bacterium]